MADKNPVIEIKAFKTIHEKYKALSENTRVQRGVSWYGNHAMDENLPEGNFTLVQIADDQYNREGSPFKEQGYIKYVPQVETKAPVEAKKVKEVKTAETKAPVESDPEPEKV